MATQKSDDHNWFGDLLMKFVPTDVDIKGETPEEMISSASWKAFMISTAAAIPPGPLGMATILPEVFAVTKVQMNLVYAIAKYYGKSGKLNKTIVTIIFANEAGVQIGKAVVRKTGPKLIIHALGAKAIRSIAQKIAARIGARITTKAAGRWIPFITAPIFGALSKSMTTKIGEEAIRLFSEDIVIQEASVCNNGHEYYEEAKFCQECGVSV